MQSFIQKYTFTEFIITGFIALYICGLIISLSTGHDSFTLYLALHPSGVHSPFQFWQLFTYALIHGSVGHLFFNGTIFMAFGNPVERIIGKTKYIEFIIISILFIGIGITINSYFKNSDTLYVGFSGTILALVTLLAFLSPRHKVFQSLSPLMKKLIIIIFVLGCVRFISVFPKNISNVLSFVILMGGSISLFFSKLMLGFSLYVISMLVTMDIAENAHHFIGILFGIVYGILYLRKLKRQDVSVETSME